MFTTNEYTTCETQFYIKDKEKNNIYWFPYFHLVVNLIFVLVSQYMPIQPRVNVGVFYGLLVLYIVFLLCKKECANIEMIGICGSYFIFQYFALLNFSYQNMKLLLTMSCVVFLYENILLIYKKDYFVLCLLNIVFLLFNVDCFSVSLNIRCLMYILSIFSIYLYSTYSSKRTSI